MANIHSLPLLVPIPPLEMPSDIRPDSPLLPPDDPQPDEFSASTLPADIEHLIPHLYPSLAVPVQGLRKSMSVDSFVHFGRDSDPTPVPHPNWGPVYGLPNNVASDVMPVFTSERDRFSFARNRRSSIGHGSLASSDFEHPWTGVERYSHTSSKDQPRPHLRGGELPLPSRTSAVSSTSSMSSVATTSSNSSTLEDTLEEVPRQGSFSSQLSLNTDMSTSRHVFTQDPQSNASPFTLIVVGTAGCGKSTAIRKGLNGCRLSKSRPASEPLLSMQGTSTRYSLRDGLVRFEDGSDYPLHVIEIDVPTGPLAPTEPPDWPDSLSTSKAVIICYDASNKMSFAPVEGLLRGYQALKVSLIVLACKSDLEPEVDPQMASEMTARYNTGLVEVAKSHDEGISSMQRMFEWVLKAVKRDKRDKETISNEDDSNYRNPASPSVIETVQLPWDNSRTATPTASRRILQEENAVSPTTLSTHNVSSISPRYVTPTNNIVAEGEVQRAVSGPGLAQLNGLNEYQKADPEPARLSEVAADGLDTPVTKEPKEKESRPGQWATLEDLLNKLLFLAVSGDDPSYITHFLLTYRRFASPRSVVLAMQQRIRQLDTASGDPMFACFAQMRICHLLELWIRDYPHDFAVRGTASALSALITSIISKTYLLHYGSEFLPFLEMLPNLVDHDAAWALKVDMTDESDDTYSPLGEDELPPSGPDSISPSPVQELPPPVAARERKSSFPMLAAGSRASIGPPDTDTSEKQQIKELLKLSQEIQALESEEIAQEITRIEVKLFLNIKPRHWLAYTFVSKKDDSEPISAFNAVSNHLADWVVSLILCHKTPRARVKQIEKLVEIAQKLRALNNYSALRAFVAGINNATFAGDETMEQFKAKCPEQAKNLQSWDVLLQQIRSHRAYRLALRNSKGACIPALEVHMSDLIKAHEGNGDFNSSDPNKIHWAQCRTAADYNFPERSHIRDLLDRSVMNDQMQKSRIAPVDNEVDDYRPTHPGAAPPRDTAILRRLFFW